MWQRCRKEAAGHVRSWLMSPWEDTISRHLQCTMDEGPIDDLKIDDLKFLTDLARPGPMARRIL